MFGGGMEKPVRGGIQAGILWGVLLQTDHRIVFILIMLPLLITTTLLLYYYNMN